MPTPAEQLTRALAQTRDMLAAVGAGEWDTLTRLQAERDPLIREALATPETLGPAEQALAEELLALNRQLEDQTRQALDTQGDATREIMRGRRAMDAYGRYGGEG